MLDEQMDTTTRRESENHFVVAHGKVGEDTPLCELHLGRGEVMKLIRELKQLLDEDYGPLR